MASDDTRVTSTTVPPSPLRAVTKRRTRKGGAEGIEPFGDGRWRIRCYLGRDADGKKQYHQRVVTGTLREAKAERARILADRAKRPTRVVPRSRATLGSWLDACIAEHFPAKYAPRTIATCAQLFRVHVPARLRSLPLNQCTPDVFREFLSDLATSKTRGRESGKGGRKGDQPIARSTIARVRSALGMAFNAATEHNLIGYNPVLGHRIARSAVRLITPDEAHSIPAAIAAESRERGMSIGEAGRFLLAADRIAHDRRERTLHKARRIDRVVDRTWPLWRLWLEVGARPAELQGLTWHDVEWIDDDEDLGALVHIRRALTERPAKDGERMGWAWKQTKTNDHRIIPVSVEAAAGLRWLQDAQARDRLIADRLYRAAEHEAAERRTLRPPYNTPTPLPARYQEHGLVFADYLGGPLSLTILRKRINAICDLAELTRRTPYELRTTMASVVATIVQSETLVQHRLGHVVSPATATRFYVRPQEGDQHPVSRALRIRLNDAVKAARETAEKSGTPLPPTAPPPLPQIESFTRLLTVDELHEAIT